MSSTTTCINPREYDAAAAYKRNDEEQLRGTDLNKISKIAAKIFSFITKARNDLYHRNLERIRIDLTKLETEIEAITKDRPAIAKILDLMILELTAVRSILESSKGYDDKFSQTNMHLRQLESKIKIHLPIMEVPEEEEK